MDNSSESVVLCTLFVVAQFEGCARQEFCAYIHYRVYSSLRDFWPTSSRSIFIGGFLKHYILACVETRD
jgi:hypothetical protein